MSVAHSALLTYNAALNKPAYQSNLHEDQYGMWNASLANDGNHETNTIKGGEARCTASQRRNPWWAVDLGHPTTIYRVDLTNAGWCDYGFLLFFCFGVSQSSVIVHNCSFHMMSVGHVKQVRNHFLLVWRVRSTSFFRASVSVTPVMMTSMQEYVEMLKELNGDPVWASKVLQTKLFWKRAGLSQCTR